MLVLSYTRYMHCHNSEICNNHVSLSGDVTGGRKGRVLFDDDVTI